MERLRRNEASLGFFDQSIKGYTAGLCKCVGLSGKVVGDVGLYDRHFGSGIRMMVEFG